MLLHLQVTRMTGLNKAPVIIKTIKCEIKMLLMFNFAKLEKNSGVFAIPVSSPHPFSTCLPPSAD